MLKKLMLLVSCISLLALVACDEEPRTSPSDATEPQTSEPVVTRSNDEFVFFDFSIEILDDEALENLNDNDLKINYAEARDGFVTEGLTLIFNFSHPVSDFTLLETDINENGFFVATGILLEIGDLDPENPLILTHYHTQGSVPRSGFYFVDPNGNERWYILHQSSMDGSITWQVFTWSHDYDFYDTNAEPEIEDEEEYVYHEVREGETLFSISRLYGTTIETLQVLNELGLSTGIEAGTRLRLPPGSVPDSTLLVNNEYDEDPEAEIGVRIEWLQEALDVYIEYYYPGANVYGRDLLITSDVIIKQFVLISINSDSDFETPEVTDEMLLFVGDLNPNYPVIFRSFFEVGTLPTRGFAFMDADGNRRFFTFTENQEDGRFEINEFMPENPPVWENLGDMEFGT